MQELQRLLTIMARLRDPERGCPWDLEQTFASIAPYTVEEAFEVADAIASGDRQALKDELGDLLLQVVFHAQMAAEEGAFSFADVAAAIGDKMTRRHPHVFSDVSYRDAAEQRQAWEAIKAEERAGRPNAPTHESRLDGVPSGLPALTRAAKLQNKAAQAGFDWTDTAPIFDKIQEELDELRQVLPQPVAPRDRIADELGDVLFACVNLARHLNVDPDQALRGTSHKFERRFRHMENQLRRQGRDPQQLSLAELDSLWEQAKRQE